LQDGGHKFCDTITVVDLVTEFQILADRLAIADEIGVELLGLGAGKLRQAAIRWAYRPSARLEVILA
jgi:hypothetical protein